VNRLQKIRTEAKTLLATVSKIFPEYTPHGIYHNDKILEIYPAIFPEQLLSTLNKFELFFLMSASYLHDIGMSELSKLRDLNTEKVHEQQREYLRDTHHLRTEKYIRENPSDFGLDDHEAHIVGKICKGHRIENLQDTNEFKHDYAFRLDKINIPLLSIMLKLADELDITYTRTPRIIYQNISFSSQKSKMEWNKHFAISGITLTQNNTIIKCSGWTSEQKIFYLIKNAEKKINKIIRELPYHLHEYRSYGKDLPRDFFAEIECRGFLAWDLQFIIDQSSILKIFTGLLLYERPEDGIRELIKNSRDTCKLRGEQISDYLYVPRIVIERREKTLLISDNGVGMNEHDIKNYFSHIGGSFYGSSEFGSVSHNFIPLSELGIGFLSAFMLGSKIEIDTKKEDSDPVKIEIEDISDFLIIRPSKKKDVGTTVKLTLKADMLENLAIKDIIAYYFRHLDIPIIVKDNNSEAVVSDNGYELPTKLVESSKGSDTKFYKIDIKEPSFTSSFFLYMRLDEKKNLFLPLERFSRSEFRSKRIVSSNGIRVVDLSILAKWLNIVPHYMDINFHDKNLKLDASRNRFVRNDYYFKIKDDLERAILLSFANYLKLIGEVCGGDVERIGKISNLFFSNYCPLDVFNFHPEDINEVIAQFVRDNYYFPCISGGIFTYMTANEILKRKVIVTTEPPWDMGNYRYLEELSNSDDFDKNINYVILTRHDTSQYTFEKKIKNDLIGIIFKPEKILSLQDIIKVETLNNADITLPKWWLFARFPNLKTDNIMEDFHDSRLLNSEHPFIKLILENSDLFKQNLNQLYFDYFLAKFGAIRYGYDLKKLVEYQEKILDVLKKEKRVSELDYSIYLIKEKNLPPSKDYNDDII